METNLGPLEEIQIYTNEADPLWGTIREQKGETMIIL